MFHIPVRAGTVKPEWIFGIIPVESEGGKTTGLDSVQRNVAMTPCV